MARNSEKHFVGLNRTFLEEQWKKDKERKRPNLQSLNTIGEVKKWIPSIKKEMNYCLHQLSGARKHDYADAKIKEFEERVQYLEREHKRFIKKVFQLDPNSRDIPWKARPYQRKRKQDSHIAEQQEATISKQKLLTVCQDLIDGKQQDSDDDSLSPLFPNVHEDDRNTEEHVGENSEQKEETEDASPNFSASSEDEFSFARDRRKSFEWASSLTSHLEQGANGT